MPQFSTHFAALPGGHFAPHKGGQILRNLHYANNANRKFCTLNGIATSFVRKGRKPKQPTAADHMRGILSKARACLMEGAFGNEKLHYGLHKVRAPTAPTEILWISFGIWTASASKIAKRLANQKAPPVAA